MIGGALSDSDFLWKAVLSWLLIGIVVMGISFHYSMMEIREKEKACEGVYMDPICLSRQEAVEMIFLHMQNKDK